MPRRDPVRRRPAGRHPQCARRAAASRREAGADAAAAARPRPGAGLHVEHGADGVPRHALDSDLSDRTVSVPSGDRPDGADRHDHHHRHDIDVGAAVEGAMIQICLITHATNLVVSIGQKFLSVILPT